uniref:Uncharacterized protein n=1 Tax=Anguilla anguilla TaxID=7936 RepID=A0A0E9U703_ANGAN
MFTFLGKSVLVKLLHALQAFEKVTIVFKL